MRRTTSLALPILVLVALLGSQSVPSGGMLRYARAATTVSSVASGNWSDPDIWDGGTVPGDGDAVAILDGHSITYDVQSDDVLGEVSISGSLTFARDTDTRLKVSDNILVNSGGKLDMGTAEDPIPEETRLEVIFVLPEGYQFTGGSTFRPEDTGLWARSGSEWYVNGSPVLHAWAKLTEDSAAGSSTVVGQHDLTDWPLGGEVIVTQTSRAFRPDTYTSEECEDLFGDYKYARPEEKSCNFFWENETGTITDLELRADGSTSITLAQPLAFAHQGTGYVRGEVGLLTHNVLVRTEITGVTDAELDQDGSKRLFAHTMLSGTAVGQIQYAEFKYMGHLASLARYPMHAHMTGSAGSSIVLRGNSIWRSGNRGYQVHNTHGMVVEGNVAFDTIMSPYYIERTGHPGEHISKSDPERTPYANWLVHNLGVQSTQAPTVGTAQQNDDTMYWIDNLDNFMFGNVGVGAGANGGTGDFAAGAEQVLSPFAALWMDERSGGTGDLQPPYFFLNEMRSNATDGIAFWPQGVNGFDFVDFTSARNGLDGIRWGYYRAPHKVFGLLAYENGDDGVGSDRHNRSGTRYVQDSEIIGNNIGIKSGPNVVRPIYPEYPYTYNRVILSDNVEANATLQAKDCSGDPEEEYPIIDRTCHANYVRFLGSVFGGGTGIDFSHGDDAAVNGGNKNTMWRIIDSLGLAGSLPSDFLLMRTDQLDPDNRTDFSREFITDSARLAGEFDNEALLVPTGSLPDEINPPTWGHTGSTSGGGTLPVDHYFTWEKAVDYPPQVALTVTMDGQEATLIAQATDDHEVDRVEFYLDDQLVATDTEAPYETEVDLTTHSRNYAYFYAIAYDDYIFRYSTAAEGAFDALPDNEDPDFEFMEYDQKAYSRTIEVGPERRANNVPTADSQGLEVDEDSSLDLTLTGADAETASADLNFTVLNQPSSGSVSGTAPNLTYTPDPDFDGTDGFAFQVDDGDNYSRFATITIDVLPINDPPESQDQNLVLDEDVVTTFPPEVSDLETATGDLAFDFSQTPEHGTLEVNADGTFTYTPDPEYSGADSFTYQVSDGEFDSDPATVSITVNPINDTPTADDLAVVTDEDTSVDLTLSGDDAETDPNNLGFAIEDPPTSGALTGVAPLLTYTPDPDFDGEDSFTYHSSDGEGQDSVPATVTIAINPFNDAPTAADQSVVTDEDAPLAFTLDAGDVDTDPADQIFTILDPPAGGTLTGAAPSLTYTPDPEFSGADSFTYRVSDGELESEVATVSITVNLVNDAPIANDLAVATDEDTSVDLTLSGDDTETGPDALSFSILTPPGNGSLSGDTPSLGYTPNPNFHGVDSFTYQASDGEAWSEVATVSISVIAVNDPPAAQNLQVSTSFGQAVPISLTGTDPETDASQLKYTVLTQPVNGNLSGTAPDLTYSPNPGHQGGDSFTFVVEDGESASQVGIVTISIGADESGGATFPSRNDSEADDNAGPDSFSFSLITNGAPATVEGVISPDPEQLERLEDALEEATGIDLRIVPGAPLELVSTDGPEPVLMVSLPLTGAPDQPIEGDINFDLGNLQVRTVDGHLTARLILDETLDVTGSRLQGNAVGGVDLVFENPKLRFTPPAMPASPATGNRPETPGYSARFVLDLKRLPVGASLSGVLARDAAALVPDPDDKFGMAAASLDGRISQLDQDVAFIVKVFKEGITNQDLGDVHVTLEVSREWFDQRVAEGKAIAIAKFDDEGTPQLPSIEVTEGCQPVSGAGTVTCDARFTGPQGGLSGFALLALERDPCSGVCGAMQPLGDNLVRVWRQDEASGEWRFHDPRPELQPSNTLTELVSGETYWVRVSRPQTVTLNGTQRALQVGWNTIEW